MTTPKILIMVAFAVTSIVGSAFWLRAKVLLRERGFPVSLFHLQWQDLEQLALLIGSEQDPVRRARLRRLRFCLLGFLLSFPLLFAAFFIL